MTKQNYLDKKEVEKVIGVYADAWVNQDVKKVLSIFTDDAVYHERVLEKPYVGHTEIGGYWQGKVVTEQSDIHFKLLNLCIDGNTVIAEWDANFLSNIKKKRVRILEVAILEFSGNKIKSMREYWQSEYTPE